MLFLLVSAYLRTSRPILGGILEAPRTGPIPPYAAEIQPSPPSNNSLAVSHPISLYVHPASSPSFPLWVSTQTFRTARSLTMSRASQRARSDFLRSLAPFARFSGRPAWLGHRGDTSVSLPYCRLHHTTLRDHPVAGFHARMEGTSRTLHDHAEDHTRCTCELLLSYRAFPYGSMLS